jgi:lipid-A-disaccharide synthase
MEIGKILMEMMSVRQDFADYQFVVAGAPSQEDGFYHRLLTGTGLKHVRNQTYDLLRHSVAALVTSGTATLETALLGVPQIVCYRGNPLSYLIARQLVNVKYISLVNLICDKPVVPELIQEQFTQVNLSRELTRILHDHEVRQDMLDNYQDLRNILGGRGASARAAAGIMQYLTSN